MAVIRAPQKSRQLAALLPVPRRDPDHPQRAAGPGRAVGAVADFGARRGPSAREPRSLADAAKLARPRTRSARRRRRPRPGRAYARPLPGPCPALARRASAPRSAASGGDEPAATSRTRRPQRLVAPGRGSRASHAAGQHGKAAAMRPWSCTGPRGGGGAPHEARRGRGSRLAAGRPASQPASQPASTDGQLPRTPSAHRPTPLDPGEIGGFDRARLGQATATSPAPLRAPDRRLSPRPAPPRRQRHAGRDARWSPGRTIAGRAAGRAAGCWLLAAGRWPVAGGLWLLGCWLLAEARSGPARASPRHAGHRCQAVRSRLARRACVRASWQTRRGPPQAGRASMATARHHAVRCRCLCRRRRRRRCSLLAAARGRCRLVSSRHGARLRLPCAARRTVQYSTLSRTAPHRSAPHRSARCPGLPCPPPDARCADPDRRCPHAAPTLPLANPPFWRPATLPMDPASTETRALAPPSRHIQGPAHISASVVSNRCRAIKTRPRETSPPPAALCPPSPPAAAHKLAPVTSVSARPTTPAGRDAIESSDANPFPRSHPFEALPPA